MTTPTHLPTTPDADPQLQPAMCKCGHVWLLDGIGLFFAEGRAHTRQWCCHTESTAPPRPVEEDA